MSDIRVNQITSLDDGAPDFDAGVIFEYSSTLSGFVINSSGTVTATAFSGDGSALTGIGGITVGKGFAVSALA